MKKLIFILIFLLLIPNFTQADGIPYPSIRPYVKEEHQIVLVELKNDELITTLDVGIRNKPRNVFPLLEESIYINENNPVWSYTFTDLPRDFNVKHLCIESRDFKYQYYHNKWPVKVSINGNTVYLYTKKPSDINFAESKEAYIRNINDGGETYCQFVTNENPSDTPRFINISTYFNSGTWNTVEIRSNTQRGFSINRVYLMGNETVDTVKIIIPFKNVPKSIEIGGRGINIWELENVFRERERIRGWYGYYGNKLLSAQEAPQLAETAMGIEESVRSEVDITGVSTDVKAGFEGKVSDLLGSISTSGYNLKSEYIVIRFADNLYEDYLQDEAYVIEFKIKPYELKRVVIKWTERVHDRNSFSYYYPLGTGRTWSENIKYTVIYVKMPRDLVVKYTNLTGSEEVAINGYRYYRWKFVESSPTQDLNLTIGKLSVIDTWIHEIDMWLKKNVAILGIMVTLFILGIIIYVRSSSKVRRDKEWV